MQAHTLGKKGSGRAIAGWRLARLPSSTVTTTGIGALWVDLIDNIVSSQVMGFTLAFTAIALVMIAIFRSLEVGAIAMVPNVMHP